jgi:hypothetical protein
MPDAKRELEELRNKYAKATKEIADILELITEDIDQYDGKQPQALIDTILNHYNDYTGGIEQVAENCRKVSAYNSKNHLPLLWSTFKSKRPTLFSLLDILNIASANQNNDLIDAMNLICVNQMKRTEHIEINDSINISFATEEWNITKDEVKRLSPYLTEHIKRFGDYLVSMLPAEAIPDEIRELKVA